MHKKFINIQNLSDTNLLKLSKTFFEKNPEIEFNPIFNNQKLIILHAVKTLNFKKGDL